MFNDYENKSMKNKTIKLKLNAGLRGYNAGSVVDIEVDSYGLPLERYWRDRLNDSKTDKCVEILKGSKK